METHTYLNRNFYDTKRNKHHTIEEVDSSSNSVSMKTEEGKLLKIYYKLHDTDELAERIEWLRLIGESSELMNVLALPFATLTGLKHGEAGYVCEPDHQHDLNYYIRPGKGEKLFKWYFDKTGGIDYRLKIGFSIANNIQMIHAKGYCLVDIHPGNTMLKSFNPEKPNQIMIQFVGTENICSYTHHPLVIGHSLYCDPLVYLNKNTNSTASDTYSFAVMLFELLTTCHPFVGEDTENMSLEEIANAVNNGMLDFIGDPESPNNKNEDFENTKLFLSEDLIVLFNRMFTVGKLDVSNRPTLDAFKSVCIQSLKRIVMCDHLGCEREYPYNEEWRCPFCNNKTNRIIMARVKRVLSASKELLLPYDDKKGFTALPLIEEDTNFMVIRSGLNKITRSFFEPSTKSEKGAVVILLQYNPDKKLIAIRNGFANLKIRVCGKELIPYSIDDKGNHSDITFQDKKEIIIELPDNAEIEQEEIAEINAIEYGKICHKWIITIR